MLVNLFDNNGITNEIVKGEIFESEISYTFNKMEFDGVTIFTDAYVDNLDVVDRIKSKYKIFWVVEPKAIYGNVYSKILNNLKRFDMILSHDDMLISKGAKFIPVGGCWIPQKSIQIHSKSKLISIIASKKVTTKGHRLRHTICNNLKLDKFGKGYKPIQYKDTALNDYMFSIAVENSSVNGYFTEKLIDCFATGTIPVYWGCTDIDKYFNTDGMIIFSDVEDLKQKQQYINYKYYESKQTAIQENFHLAKQYYPIENWLYYNLLKELCT